MYEEDRRVLWTAYVFTGQVKLIKWLSLKYQSDII